MAGSNGRYRNPVLPADFATAGISGPALIGTNFSDGYQSKGSEANKLYKFNGTYYHFYSEVQGATRVMMRRAAAIHVQPWTHEVIWLRSGWGFDGKSTLAVGADGLQFQPLLADFPLTWGAYRGSRIGLFTFNPEAERGYVDVDAVSYAIGERSGASMHAARPQGLGRTVMMLQAHPPRGDAPRRTRPYNNARVL